MHTKTATAKLGPIAEYPLAWGNLAIHRFRSIPGEQRGIVGPGQLAQLTWAAFAGVRLPFATWEHVLAVIAELPSAEYEALDAAVASVLPDPEPKPVQSDEKPTPEPSDAEKKSNLTASEHSPAVASA